MYFCSRILLKIIQPSAKYTGRAHAHTANNMVWLCVHKQLHTFCAVCFSYLNCIRYAVQRTLQKWERSLKCHFDGVVFFFIFRLFYIFIMNKLMVLLVNKVDSHASCCTRNNIASKIQIKPEANLLLIFTTPDLCVPQILFVCKI